MQRAATCISGDMENRTRRAGHRFVRFGAVAAVATWAGVALATPITYSFSGTGRGTIGGMSFTDAAFSIVVKGDTQSLIDLSHIGTHYGGPKLNGGPTTITVAGIGTATFTETEYIILQSDYLSLGSYYIGPLFTFTVEYGPPLYAWGLQSSIGPLVSTGPPSALADGPSDQGPISLTSASVLTFQAVTTCGNGVVDADEQCDDGNDSDADCCAPSCAFSRADTKCRYAVEPCDAEEFCTGTSATCPPDVGRAEGADCIGGGPCSIGVGTCQSGTCVSGPRDCDDHMPCTQDSCDPSIGCVHVTAPASGCLAAQKSQLTLTPTVYRRAAISWRWVKGAPLSLEDFADPSVDATYGLCVYAGSTPALIADALLPAGAQWSRAGTSGYKFKDTASPTSVRLRSGAAGKSAASMVSRDIAQERPFPLAAPVTVQLIKSGSPLCLQSQFALLQQSDPQKLRVHAP